MCRGEDGFVHLPRRMARREVQKGLNPGSRPFPAKVLLGCSGGPNAGRLFCEGRIPRPMTRSVQPMTVIPDDETISLVVQRPGDDESVRIAEAGVGDIRSALK